jgi:predicted N-formylglutamate amidohydrolase
LGHPPAGDGAVCGFFVERLHLVRHIAWDVGAAGAVRELSSRFDSPAILFGTSRLVIDCNRHPGAPDLIPETNDGTLIPGNQNVMEHAKQSSHRAVVHTLP